MDHLLRDVRQSLRLVLKERTFSGTVLVTLAVCLGANVALFSVINTVLLEPLPFREPDRLVTVYNSYPGAGAERSSNGSFDFFQRRENVAAFEGVALHQGGGNTVGESGSAERISSLRVSASFFPLLGIEPALGRTFTEDEMDPGNEMKVVLTHGFWMDHFAGEDPLGRDLRIDGRPFEVVGVLPEDLTLPFSADARLFLPIRFTPEARLIDGWHSNNYQMIARLRPGATVEEAAAQNEALNDALIDQWPQPNARQLLDDVGYHTVVVPTQADLVRDVGPVLYMLWAGVAFVLLIGCVNIANLTLARANARVAEVATQLALGAPGTRVARQVFTHAVVLALLGGALGVGVGAVGLRFLQGLGIDQLPRGTEIGLDGSVLLFVLILAVVAGTLFGAIPMAQVMRGDLSPVFRSGGRGGTASHRAVLLRNALVTGQVTLAFVMVVGAGLMLGSFRAALSVDPGFDAERVLTASVSIPGLRYPDENARRGFWDQLLAEVRALPGVEAASMTQQLPFSGNTSSSVAFPEGYLPPAGESLLSPYQTVTGPGYLEAMGIDLVEGRGFNDSDGPGETRVIVIDEWLAKRYWPDRSPLGSRMVVGQVPGDSIEDESLYTVVGVVRTIKQNDLTTPASEHVGAYYFTYRQNPSFGATVTVRARSGDATALTPAIRNVLARIDGELPLFGVETMEQKIDESLLQRRVPLVLLGVFAGVALFLAVVGIYGALAYTVTQRRREIGIRIAMGSAPSGVFRSVVLQGLSVTAVGVGLGVLASLLLTGLIESLLFDVQPQDPFVLAAGALLIGGVGLVACVVPARRATRVSPVEALLGQ
jgi:predicted permease